MPGMKDLVKGTDRYRNYIGGQWVESTLKEWIEVENPATEETIDAWSSESNRSIAMPSAIRARAHR